TAFHGQYTAMGGFALEFSHAAKRATSDILRYQRRITLTPDTLKDLAELHPDFIPNISEAEILDKSKASAFAKTLVCIQAGWLCVQRLVRLAQNLSISLFELNTFAHSICTFLVYLMWCDKPLDIGEPSFLQSGAYDAINAAYQVLPTITHYRTSTTKTATRHSP
ncbi:hypothetical protein BU23DRAFT_461731, partial [Bimuria novae-zelandiae CBS 107.79]